MQKKKPIESLKAVMRKLYRGHDFKIIRNRTRPGVKAMKKLNKKCITAIEVGVNEGVHAENMLRNLSIHKLILVDSYQKEWKYAQKIAHERLEQYPVAIKFWLKKKSVDASHYFKKEYADFIYIDGDHSYKEVYRDLIAWYPKVKEGGIFAGHDVLNQDVFDAVTDFCLKEGIDFEYATPDWIIRK
jgi:predicted O-methyltransferase YrrM